MATAPTCSYQLVLALHWHTVNLTRKWNQLSTHSPCKGLAVTLAFPICGLQKVSHRFLLFYLKNQTCNCEMVVFNLRPD